MKYLIIGIIFVLIVIFVVGKAFATQPEPYKVICHHTPAQAVTLSFVNEQAYAGHLGTPHSTETFDTNGACVETTPTPTKCLDKVTPTLTSTLTPTLTLTPTVSTDPTATPTAGLTQTTASTQGDGKSDGRSDGKSSGASAVTPKGPPATGFAR